MCYGMGCGYEDYYGECRKPGCEPCPMDEKYDGPYEPWNFDQKCKEEAMRLREEWRKESESAS